jgi:phage tail sheath protein FI
MASRAVGVLIGSLLLRGVAVPRPSYDERVPDRRNASEWLRHDPSWKYVNVRRLYVYIEHSIDEALQWVVFEPNNEELWRQVRRQVEDFLTGLWRGGRLVGTTPEEAFFVKVDRSTMTQDDVDNGRLVVLVGVAAVKPAEFVIFRIGQWTSLDDDD